MISNWARVDAHPLEQSRCGPNATGNVQEVHVSPREVALNQPLGRAGTGSMQFLARSRN